MIRSIADYFVSVVSPSRAVKRAHARKVESSIRRGYRGGESNRMTAHQNPKNQSANSELQGPYGADSLRAWARMLVRDNPYAWAALESIVSEVIGTGFGIESALESDTGEDEPDTNVNRDATWGKWCEVCDINGELTFNEMQVLAFREMVEAGECLIRYHTVPTRHKGIERPVPLAIELIEADRIASDRDSYYINRKLSEGRRITRGVEMDEKGRVVAYWIYPAHPTEPNVFSRTAERVEAHEVKHLYRKDRIGQSRGVTWFAPIVEPLRGLGTYIDNEIQASTVASCFTTFIKTDTPIDAGQPPSTDDDVQDANGSTYQFLEPGIVVPLQPHESIETANPGRPNTNAGPWIKLMVQGIAAGTGTSYESVSKDFSQTSYSSSRTSKLENRPRYRRWQNYWSHHFCMETHDRFCTAAARVGREEFPTMVELLDDRRKYAPVDIQTPEWEWVDVQAEQASSEAAVAAHQRCGTDVAGSMGKNYRRTQKKIAQEKALRMKLGDQFGVDMRTAAEARQAADISKETTAEAAVVTAEANAEEVANA